MLDALNILNGVFLSSTLLSSVTLYSDGDYVVQKTDEVSDVATVISTHREWWRSESKCKYIGVMVPYGDELKGPLDNCAVLAAARKQREEAEIQRKAQARIDADTLFEQQKTKHKMRPGVQLLGDMGANNAKRLVDNCFEAPNFLRPSREASMPKEQWRQSRCGGYYKEEVEDLLRELRIRGIVSN